MTLFWTAGPGGKSGTFGVNYGDAWDGTTGKCWSKADRPLCVYGCSPGLYPLGDAKLNNYTDKLPTCQYCSYPT